MLNIFISFLFTIYIHQQKIFTFADLSKIDNDLWERVEAGSRANAVVWFQNGVRSTIEAASAQRYADTKTKNNAIVAALEENAESSQSDVIQMLSSRSSSGGFTYFRKFWTNNKLFIKEADKETIQSVSDDPKVTRIQLEPIYRLPIPTEREDPVDPNTLPPAVNDDARRPGFNQWRWNIYFIKVREAWAELGGKMGEGVVVAIIDSGARGSHVQLRNSFRGEYGWFDAVDGNPEPYDAANHGSHVLGIMVGYDPEEEDDKRIGVAPGAKWMACLGCPTEECNFEHIIKCIEFISCPTYPDGSNRDCSKAPDVLNFSIAGNRTGEPFDDDFATLRALGIIPVAGIGNDGPQCGTALSPGQWSFAIGVGATIHSHNYQEELLWAKSSLGPSLDNQIKPDLVAPGGPVLGPVGNDDKMQYFSIGTSNASPHVAGVVALLHVRNPDLTFEEAYELLTQSTDTDISITNGEQCNETSQVFPNNWLGWGRVNAFKAVQAQTAAMRK